MSRGTRCVAVGVALVGLVGCKTAEAPKTPFCASEWRYDMGWLLGAPEWFASANHPQRVKDPNPALAEPMEFRVAVDEWVVELPDTAETERLLSSGRLLPAREVLLPEPGGRDYLHSLFRACAGRTAGFPRLVLYPGQASFFMQEPQRVRYFSAFAPSTPAHVYVGCGDPNPVLEVRVAIHILESIAAPGEARYWVFDRACSIPSGEMLFVLSHSPERHAYRVVAITARRVSVPVVPQEEPFAEFRGSGR